MRPLAHCFFLFALLASGQTAPTFDVATIKQAPPPDPQKMMTGQIRMGMNIDGARAEYSFMSMTELICKAYDIKPHQLTGPDWMKTIRWDIQATIPEGASKDQVPAMLQALLKERFKMEVHKDTKEVNVYALIQGKNGHKMKTAEPEPVQVPAADGDSTLKEEPAKDVKGGPMSGTMTVNGEKMTMKQTSNGMIMKNKDLGEVKTTFGNGQLHMEMGAVEMPKFAEMLSQFVDRPVNDETQLKGKYQAVLEFSMGEMMNMARRSGMGGPGMGGPPGGGPGGGNPGGVARPAEAAEPGGVTVFASVEQLGLKLAPRKGPVAMIVVDKIEKTPTEN